MWSRRASVPVAFSIAPNPIAGGGVATATVTMDIPAPPGGELLTISESAPQLSCPATVFVPEGATVVTFPVTTSYTPSIIVRSVTVSNGSVSLTATLTLTKILMATFSMAPTNVYGGTSSTGTITLTAPAPPGFSIRFTDNMPYVYSPSSVAFALGATSASFVVPTRPTPTTYPAVISASKSTQIWNRSLNVFAPALTSLAVSSNSVTGGTAFTATVAVLGTAYYGGVPVALLASGPEMIPPPLTTIPYTLSSKAVTVQTTPVFAQVVRTLTATYNGVSRTKSVVIKP